MVGKKLPLMSRVGKKKEKKEKEDKSWVNKQPLLGYN